MEELKLLPDPMWFISYAAKSRFQGACFVRASTCEEAEAICVKLNIRPKDAQFAGFELSDQQALDVDETLMGRLLTRGELETALPHWGFKTHWQHKQEGRTLAEDRAHIRESS